MAKRKKLRKNRVLFVIIVFILLISLIGFGAYFIYHKIKGNTNTPQANATPHVATVVLDPGHGGKDGGTTNGSLYEKDIVLKVSQYMSEELKKHNVKVIQTRTTDAHLDDQKIADLDKRIGLIDQHQAQYFISLHVNDYEGPDRNQVNGFEIYIMNEMSRPLADHMLTSFNELNLTRNRGVNDKANYHVLRYNKIPSVLVELGYIHSKDHAYLSNDDKLKTVANSLAKGILNTINEGKEDLNNEKNT